MAETFVALQLVTFVSTLPQFSHGAKAEFDSGLGGQVCGVVHFIVYPFAMLLIKKTNLSLS